LTARAAAAVRAWLAVFLCGGASALAAEGTVALPRTSPEAQAIPSEAILKFVETAEAKIDALHSIMIVRHGSVVAEGWWTPYRKDAPHMLYSLSKSFTSTAVGLAINEGKLSLDDPVLKFFPEDAPPDPSANLKAMRVRDLLSMSTGQHGTDVDPFPFQSEESLTKRFLSLPIAHKPGTHFWYNTAATYMLSAIVQKVTGQKLIDYLGPRLFVPLGIQNPTWEESKQGVAMGGFGLKITTEDIARFGQLYLQKGAWQGKQLVPSSWVETATSRQVSNGSNPESDWEQGYGYQFWRCRHGVYRGDGAFGQFCVVMPEHDTVVAITSGTRDLQGVLDVVWDTLLPSLGTAALPARVESERLLTRKLANLSLPIAAGKPTSPLARKVVGRTFVFPPNDDKLESVSLQTNAKETNLVLRINGQERPLAVGSGTWRQGGAVVMGGLEQKMAGTGAWTSDDTFSAKACGYESPYCVKLDLRFAGDEVTLDRELNVTLGQPERKRPTLVGHLQAATRR
jgi:CubicO group peptidase (beta-lactamase class C family)